MTIAATADLLQAVNQAVSGVNAAGAPAFANYGSLINSAGQLRDLLPAAMSWPERTTLTVLGNVEYEMLIDWGIYVYAARDFQENTITGMSTTMTLAQAFMAAYLDKDSYTITDGQFILAAGPPVIYVNRVAPINQAFANQNLDIAWAGIAYHGFKLTLQTKEEGTL